MKFNGQKVYLALRPNIFESGELGELKADQHITVEYFGDEPDFAALVYRAKLWANLFGDFVNPVLVQVTGYANWVATNNKIPRYYSVALVSFPEFNHLNFMKNWHITMDQSSEPLACPTYSQRDDQEHYDYIGRLWVGYTDFTGEKKWLPFTSADQMLDEREIPEWAKAMVSE